MNENEQWADFRQKILIKALNDLAPKMKYAVERAVTADQASKEAMLGLQFLMEQIDRLHFAVTIDEPDAENLLRETIVADQIIQQMQEEEFVYFIEAGDYIKIGHSRDPINRLSQIRKRQGVKLPDGLDPSRARILTVEPGGQSYEKRLHGRFAEHRAAGEWFSKNERLTHYIKSIATPA